MSRYILDVATGPLAGAEDWVPPVKAAGNLVDPVKIAASIAAKQQEQRETMALDPDLCRISAIGLCDVTAWEHGPILTMDARTEAEEVGMLARLHAQLQDAETITYNGLSFDLPVLERRMLYCGLPSLGWNLDRYRSPHVDLMAKLSDHGKRPYRPLGFYVKRLGWSDLSKPLSGAEEAQAPAQGRWDELQASVSHDVEATRRLAVWMGVLKPSQVPV